jgi:AraC-like DNA-binding protein
VHSSRRPFTARLAPDGQFLRLFDFLLDVSFFIKDRDGRFMALSLNKFDHVHGHFGQSLISNELAAMAGLSVSQFERRFRGAFGTFPRQYLVRIRVDAAAKLLIETERTVSEIALECGFHDHPHFSHSFRKII